MTDIPNPNPSKPAPKRAKGVPPKPSTLNSQPSTPGQPPFSPAPDEPHNAFEAFLVFFNLKGKRHLTVVARQTGASLSTINRWAKNFDWSGRLNRHRAQLLQQSAATHDALAARQHQDTLDWAERSASLREREWEIADDLLDAIAHRLDSDVLDEATLADIARSFALASRIGRLATGLPNTPPDQAPVQDSGAKEFNDALERIVNHHKAQHAAAAAAAAAASNTQPPVTPNL